MNGPSYKTSTDSGHSHTWWGGGEDGCTSMDAGHKHKYYVSDNYTMPGGKDGHVHMIVIEQDSPDMIKSFDKITPNTKGVETT